MSEEQVVRDRNTPQKVVCRARTVLMARKGLTAITAAPKRVLTIRRWHRRSMHFLLSSRIAIGIMICIHECPSSDYVFEWKKAIFNFRTTYSRRHV